ncbi:MAG: (2Fe-2S) ferredoxin domain-containing protein [Ruminococcaceae bacterium]|nr:(2Fe-2S) ferredoxin domain-containing protein [Oscillospiraceae bacterium]
MKSIAELEAIRKNTLENVKLRKTHQGYKVVVGMATCGITAGARAVMKALLDGIAKKNLSNVTITQTDCIGKCQLEPIVDVYNPNGEKTTYVKLTPDKVSQIVEEHIAKGNVVTEFTIDSAE